jgi:hypothetical protein
MKNRLNMNADSRVALGVAILDEAGLRALLGS